MKNILTILLLISIVQNAFSIEDPPLITCLEVHEGGDVTIYWELLDPSATDFQIFYSLDNVNWTWAYSAEALNTSLSYNHSSANANIQIYYYKVVAIYPSGSSRESISSTIFFGVIPNLIEGIAELGWANLPFNSTSSSYYTIYQSKYIVGEPPSWILIDSTTHVSYLDTIANGLCFDSLNYKIEVSNSYGCRSVSNIAGVNIGEKIKPDKPVLDSVSINAEGNVIMGWEPISSPDISNMVISRKVGIAWPPTAEVIIPYATYYEDTIQNPCTDMNIIYAIASVDSCGNLSPKTEDTEQRPIFLHNIDYDLCSSTNSIVWESYINATPPLDSYQIWASTNNGTPIKIDEVSPTQTYYDHINVDNVTEYSYFVRAKFGSFSSTSCTKSITTGSYVVPTSIYLANANVQFDNSIDLTIDVDLLPQKCTWEVFRSDAGGGTQSLLTSLNRNEITASPYIYEDNLADGSTGYYTYSIDVFDSCGAQVLKSNTLKTIFLQGSQTTENKINLQWNSFEGWDENVGKYYIYRFSDDIIPTKPIDSTDGVTNEYTDDISSVATSMSKFTYWVQAVEAYQNSYNYMEKSNSNAITFFRDTELYMPNAFRPGGTNNIFKPVTTGFGGSKYLFQIYNRWGQLIFESTAPQKGWDGYYKGERAPQGTYIYRLVYESVFGSPKSQKGTVTLIE